MAYFSWEKKNWWGSCSSSFIYKWLVIFEFEKHMAISLLLFARQTSNTTA